MAVHEDILRIVSGLCAGRGQWTFRTDEVVGALPGLKPGTVRTHVTSRLCVNAPSNHPHRWPYFKRVSRGLYEVLPPYRRPAPALEVRPRKHLVAGEVPRVVRDTAHACVSRDLGWYVAECLEVPVVVQGRTMDETIGQLRAAIDQKLAAENPARFGLARSPRVLVTFEFRLARSATRV